MKTGRRLQDLAIELDRQAAAKQDYVAPTQRLHMHDDGLISLENEGIFPATTHAHGQIGDRLGIPAKYYKKMQEEAPHLLARNVNHWFKEEPEKRLVRTLDGNIRAFLSDRYRPLDNFDLAESVLPVLTETSAQVVSCEVTDTKMYLKAIIPDRVEEIGPPTEWEWGRGHHEIDKVQAGIVISNSEIGKGGLYAQPAVHTVHCSNLAVWRESQFKKHHIGGNLGKGEHDGIWRYMTDDTRRKTDEAIWYQIRDLVQAALVGNVFEDIVHQLRVARNHKIEGDIPAAIEVVTKNYGFNEGEKKGILSHLIEGGEPSQYGLHAAVTRMAEDVEDYDRASEIELIGADIIQLPRSEWQVISNAA